MQTPSPSALFAQTHTHTHTQFIKFQFSPVAFSSRPSHCNGSSEVGLSQIWLLAWIPSQECCATPWWAHSASCSHLSQEKPQFYKQGCEVMPPACPSRPRVSQPCFVLCIDPRGASTGSSHSSVARSHAGMPQPPALL